MPMDPLVTALRRAGCVFAEEEASILRASTDDATDLDRLLRARVDGAPLEQLVGWVAFRGLRLEVGPHVFVPRQRTMLLADVAIAEVRARMLDRPNETVQFVEAFAGVAPIAAAVRAERLSAQVHATDLDEEALRYARANLGDSAGIHRGSVLTSLPPDLRGRVDIIAAIPPYVPDAHVDLLPREARDFEPSVALFGGEDGLDHARELIAQAVHWLAPGGALLLELHSTQVEAAHTSADQLGYRTAHRSAPDGHTAVVILSATRTHTTRSSRAAGDAVPTKKS